MVAGLATQIKAADQTESGAPDAPIKRLDGRIRKTVYDETGPLALDCAGKGTAGTGKFSINRVGLALVGKDAGDGL